MPQRILKGTESDFVQFKRKRFIAIITDDNVMHFAVRSLDLDKKQEIIHCNGGSGRFFDERSTTIREYIGTKFKVLALREFY